MTKPLSDMSVAELRRMATSGKYEISQNEQGNYVITIDALLAFDELASRLEKAKQAGFDECQRMAALRGRIAQLEGKLVDVEIYNLKLWYCVDGFNSNG